MANFEGVSANHVYVAGYEPKETNQVAEALLESIAVIGPTILIVLCLYLVVQRMRDLRLAKSVDGLSPKKRALLEEKRAQKVAEMQEAVHNLRKQRQQNSGLV